MQTQMKIQFKPRQSPRVLMTLLAPPGGIPGGTGAVTEALAEQDWLILRAVSQSFQRAGLLDLALEWAQAAADAAARNLPAQLHLGTLYLGRGDWAAARELAAQLVEALPAAAMPKRLMSQALREQGDMAGALDWARRAVQDAPADAGTVTHLGTLQQQAGDLEAALATARRGLEALPDAPGLLRLMARIHEARGETDTALEWARRVVQASPGDAGALAQLAGMQLQAGATAEVEDMVRAALAQQPRAVPLLRLMMRLAQGRGALDEALDWARQARAAAPDANAANQIANLLMQQGESGKAMAEVQDGLARTPGSAPLMRTRSMLLQRAGDLDGALDWARCAVAAAPSDGGMIAHLSGLHLERKEPAEARRVALDALDGTTGRGAVLLALSRAATAAGALQDAHDWALKAVQERPGDANARRALERCTAALG